MSDLKIELLDDGREFVGMVNAGSAKIRAQLVHDGFVFRDEQRMKSCREGWFRSPTRGDGALG